VIAYFIPILHQVPLFGLSASTRWFWNINISPAFVGQGIITGLAISAHMMLGAIVGWGVLSPLAKAEGWAPGEPADWETGSRGWTVWVSVAALLADCFVKLFWYGGRLVVRYGRSTLNTLWQYLRGKPVSKTTNYSPIPQNDAEASQSQDEADAEETADMDHTLNNPPQNSVQSSTNTPDPPYSSLIPFQITLLALLLSITFCIVSVKFTLGPFMPVWTLLLAILLAMLFSIMAVQSVGETDINPVGAIGKISQFAFALLIPLSHPHALLINLIAGGIAEAGTNQAGDLIYDLKTGHLLNVPPDALFMGQLIGSAFGALVSVAFYRLYSFVYPIPGDMFPVPAAYVWITTSRLVLGEGLPEKAGVFSIAAAAIFALTTTVKLGYADRWWQYLIPSGVAFSIGGPYPLVLSSPISFYPLTTAKRQECTTSPPSPYPASSAASSTTSGTTISAGIRIPSYCSRAVSY
jgi:OPT family oligopeptide transporter